MIITDHMGAKYFNKKLGKIKNYEIIFIDDKSTDLTKQKILSIIKKNMQYLKSIFFNNFF